MSTTESRVTTSGPTDPAKGAPDQAVKETLEDYTLRFAPRSYRRWSPMVVATTALGGIAYMFYSNCAIAWVVTVATDIGINKYVRCTSTPWATPSSRTPPSPRR